jgi:hypothetical protein
MSEAQVEALLDTPTADTALGQRDRAMLELMYASGLRVSELVGLKTFHLSLNEGVLRVMGKGNKERLVPFGQVARESINTYLAEGRPAILGGQQTEDLFVTARGSAMRRSLPIVVSVSSPRRTACGRARTATELARDCFGSSAAAGGCFMGGRFMARGSGGLPAPTAKAAGCCSFSARRCDIAGCGGRAAGPTRIGAAALAPPRALARRCESKGPVGRCPARAGAWPILACSLALRVATASPSSFAVECRPRPSIAAGMTGSRRT